MNKVEGKTNNYNQDVYKLMLEIEDRLMQKECK